MIAYLVNIFYDLASKHKLVRGFKYDNISKCLGVGDEKHIYFYLEEPIYISNSSMMKGSVNATINFDIVMTLQGLDNFNVKKPTPQIAQNLAYHIALNMIAKLRHDNLDEENDRTIQVENYSIMTLERFGDNETYGVRVTLKLSLDNDIAFCDIDEHFDEDKTIDVDKYLQDIITDDATSCNSEHLYKLPIIDL